MVTIIDNYYYNVKYCIYYTAMVDNMKYKLYILKRSNYILLPSWLYVDLTVCVLTCCIDNAVFVMLCALLFNLYG